MSWSEQQACIRGSSCPEVAMECWGPGHYWNVSFGKRRGQTCWASLLMDGHRRDSLTPAQLSSVWLTGQVGSSPTHFLLQQRVWQQQWQANLPTLALLYVSRQFHTVRARKQIHSTNTLTYWSLLLLDSPSWKSVRLTGRMMVEFNFKLCVSKYWQDTDPSSF